MAGLNEFGGEGAFNVGADKYFIIRLQTHLDNLYLNLEIFASPHLLDSF